jgi:hypothetical protein
MLWVPPYDVDNRTLRFMSDVKGKEMRRAATRWRELPSEE